MFQDYQTDNMAGERVWTTEDYENARWDNIKPQHRQEIRNLTKSRHGRELRAQRQTLAIASVLALILFLTIQKLIHGCWHLLSPTILLLFTSPPSLTLHTVDFSAGGTVDVVRYILPHCLCFIFRAADAVADFILGCLEHGFRIVDALSSFIVRCMAACTGFLSLPSMYSVGLFVVTVGVHVFFDAWYFRGRPISNTGSMVGVNGPYAPGPEEHIFVFVAISALVVVADLIVSCWMGWS